MMTYYCKQGYNYQPKNRLQTAAQKALGNLDGLLVTDPDAMTAYLTKQIDQLNLTFPKCTPLEVRVQTEPNFYKERSPVYYIKDGKMLDGSLITFTLQPIRGEFVSLPKGDVQIQLIEGKEATDAPH